MKNRIVMSFVSLLNRRIAMSGGWDETKHPRIPKGDPGGGKFTDGSGGGGRFATTQEWSDHLSAEHVSAINSWTGPGHDRMRLADLKGRTTGQIQAMKDAISTAPTYEGSIHRGMVVKLEDADNVFKENGEFGLQAMTSFTKNSHFADVVFSHDGRWLEGFNAIPAVAAVLHVDRPKTAFDIHEFSRRQSHEEVVVTKGTRYRVKRIEKGPHPVTKGAQLWHVHMEET